MRRGMLSELHSSCFRALSSGLEEILFLFCASMELWPVFQLFGVKVSMVLRLKSALVWLEPSPLSLDLMLILPVLSSLSKTGESINFLPLVGETGFL